MAFFSLCSFRPAESAGQARVHAAAPPVGSVQTWWARLRAWLTRRAPAAPPTAAAPTPKGKLDHLSRKDRIKRYGHRNITLAGDVVQSGPERRIADWLHKRGIRYVYEMQIPGATPDFYLPDHNVVIEHWGMDHPKYREKRMMKVKLYRSRGYRLVETEKKDVPRLEAVLEARLRAEAPELFER